MPTTEPNLDPDRRVTPGGFHTNSPFTRQHVAPQPVEKPEPTTKPETTVNMADLEEANDRIEQLIQQLGGVSDDNRRFAAAAYGVPVLEYLEEIGNLIYRNLR